MKKQEIEYWRELVVNSAKEWCLENEVLEKFNQLIEIYPPDEAAFCACYEWDIELQVPQSDH